MVNLETLLHYVNNMSIILILDNFCLPWDTVLVVVGYEADGYG